jgi:hypothetical protein
VFAAAERNVEKRCQNEFPVGVQVAGELEAVTGYDTVYDWAERFYQVVG